MRSRGAPACRRARSISTSRTRRSCSAPSCASAVAPNIEIISRCWQRPTCRSRPLFAAAGALRGDAPAGPGRRGRQDGDRRIPQFSRACRGLARRGRRRGLGDHRLRWSRGPRRGAKSAGRSAPACIRLMGPMMMGVLWRRNLVPAGGEPIDLGALAAQHAETRALGAAAGEAPAASDPALLAPDVRGRPELSRPDVAVPASYSERMRRQIGDIDLAAWWRGFGDPELDHSGRSGAVAQNLDVETGGGAHPRSPSARRRRRRGRVASSRRRQARSPVSGSAKTPSRSRPAPAAAAAAFGLPGTEFTTWRAGFDASWELDLFGKHSPRQSKRPARAPAAAIWNRRDAAGLDRRRGRNRLSALRTLQPRIMPTPRPSVAAQQRLERWSAHAVRGGLVNGQDFGPDVGRPPRRAAIPALAGAGGGADPRARRAHRRRRPKR